MSNSQADTLSLADFQSEIANLGFQAKKGALYQRILEGVSQMFKVDSASIFLLKETEGELLRKTLTSPSNQQSPRPVMHESIWRLQVDDKPGSGLVRECLRLMTPILSNQVQDDARFDPSNDALVNEVRSSLCAPMIAEGELYGAIQLIKKLGGGFDDFDLALLVKIATQSAISIRGADAINRLQESLSGTEIRRQELITSRDILKSLFDHLPMALYIVDQDYQLVAINRNRIAEVKETPPLFENQLCYVTLFNRLEPCNDCRIMETFRDGTSTQRIERRNGVEAGMELDFPGKEVKEWEINTHPIFDNQGKVCFSIVLEKDTTEKYLLENILARSEKLAVIGQLAAGVAHEINNPLTAIIANAQILHRELPAESDLQDSVDLISRAGARAAQVVRNLLDFARKEEYHLGLTDINETVERALDLIRHELMARSVQLEYKPDARLPLILASEDHLQSVWLNLLLNAIDALDKEPGAINVTTRTSGSEIHVSISDNGKGIPPERLTRIFEPFFTTKAPGRGTGLGLSVSHRIVRQHGGNIRVESKVGSGSDFVVILPAG